VPCVSACSKARCASVAGSPEWAPRSRNSVDGTSLHDTVPVLSRGAPLDLNFFFWSLRKADPRGGNGWPASTSARPKLPPPGSHPKPNLPMRSTSGDEAFGRGAGRPPLFIDYPCANTPPPRSSLRRADREDAETTYAPHASGPGGLARPLDARYRPRAPSARRWSCSECAFGLGPMRRMIDRRPPASDTA